MATIDRLANYENLDLSEDTLYTASTLSLLGLPFDFASLRYINPLTRCPTCYVALMDPLLSEPLHKRLLSWQSHLGRCGGYGRCLQAHEVVKLVVNRLLAL